MDFDFVKYLNDAADVITTYAFDLFGAMAIIVFGVWFSRWAQNKTRALVDRSSRVDNTLKPLLARLVRYAVLIFMVLAVLNQFGVHTTGFIAVLGAAGLAIGLALQGTLSNIASGLMLLFLRPVNVGDYVDASGHTGTVTTIGLFTTEMRTVDGLFRSIPNRDVWSGAITNYSRNPTRRIDLDIGIGYDDDLKKGMDVLREVAAGHENVLQDPAPQTLVVELGDSAVVIRIRCWTKTSDYWATLCDLTRDAKLALDAKGFSIPYPQQDVHMFPQGEPRAA